MNTEVGVAAPDLGAREEHELALEVEQLFRDTERRFSRFLPASEIGRLNASADRITVSRELLELLLRARAHAHDTGGIFEPAVGIAMRSNGYDRSFTPGGLDRDAAPSAAPAASIAMLDIDEARCQVQRPPHVEIDLGGFLKGHTADRAATLTFGSILIDAGGDAVVRCAPSDEVGWTVEIEDPRDPSRILGTIALRDGAVATSAANRRSWRRGTQTMHHLIDPRTRAPARTDVIQATVIATTAEVADVLAKVAFVLGATAAAHMLTRRGVSAVLVLADGSLQTVGDVELHRA